MVEVAGRRYRVDRTVRALKAKLAIFCLVDGQAAVARAAPGRTRSRALGRFLRWLVAAAVRRLWEWYRMRSWEPLPRRWDVPLRPLGAA